MTPEELERFERNMQRTAAGTAILGYQRMNPEQKLAYCLQHLITLGKEKLLVTELATQYAKELVEWRKTPEGQAYAEYVRKKQLPPPEPSQ